LLLKSVRATNPIENVPEAEPESPFKLRLGVLADFEMRKFAFDDGWIAYRTFHEFVSAKGSIESRVSLMK
jgi:hypothetical protein